MDISVNELVSARAVCTFTGEGKCISVYGKIPAALARSLKGHRVAEIFPSPLAAKITRAMAECLSAGKRKRLSLRLAGKKGLSSIARINVAGTGRVSISFGIPDTGIPSPKSEPDRSARPGYESFDDPYLYRYFIEHSINSFVVADAKTGEILNCNEAFAALVGRRREEVAGMFQRDLHPSVKRTGDVTDCFIEYQRKLPEETHETVFLLPDGSLRDAEFKGGLFRLGGRDVVWGMFSDITKRKRAEIKLKESNAQYLAIFEHSPISIWVEDFSDAKAYLDEKRAQGITGLRSHFKANPSELRQCVRLIRVLDINNSSLAIFSGGSKQYVIDNLERYFNEDTLDVFREELMALYEGSTEFHSEAPISDLAGGIKHLLVSVSVVPGYEETLGRVLVSFREITELKKTEAKLQESATMTRILNEGLESIVEVRTRELLLANRFLAATSRLNQFLLTVEDERALLAETCRIMASVCGYDLVWIGYLNQGSAKGIRPVWYGYGAETMMDSEFALEDVFLAAEAVRNARPVWVSNVEEFDDSLVCQCYKKAGMHSIMALPLKNKGDVFGVLSICSLTPHSFDSENKRSFLAEILNEATYGIMTIRARNEHRRASDEMASQQRALEEARKLEVFGMLTGGVAHEVRNPLNAIMGITEALSRRLKGQEEYNAFITHMKEQVERLSKLMRDLLELGRPIEQSNMVPVRLFDICSASLNQWRYGRWGGLHRVSFDHEESIASVLVRADGSKLQQVIINVLDNAAQQSPVASQITLRISLDGDWAVISVEDQGGGIEEQNMQKIFEPFFTTRRSGTGLGLSIVRHIVDSHGGCISIRNNTGASGCTLEIRMPIDGAQGG